MFSDISWTVILMQLFFGLALGSIFVLLASGLSIIYGLLDVVNFAHGTFAMLGATRSSSPWANPAASPSAS